MFGILRTSLALMVMVYHLLLANIQIGTYAVFGFYIISGFLMTTIMHDKYGYHLQGRKRFVINRFLRLFPLYWLALLLSVLLIILLGLQNAHDFHTALFLPNTISGALSNALMIFPAWRPVSVNPNLVPPVWALTIELFFYILICLGISKTPQRVMCWFFLSLLYVGFSLYLNLPSQDRYYPVLAASLPFSMGAAIYFLKQSLTVKRLNKVFNYSSFLLFISVFFNCLVWVYLSRFELGNFIEIGFYINILLCFLLVLSIASGREILSINLALDRKIGNYSYPIYLFHISAGLIMYKLIGEKFTYLSTLGIANLVGSLFIVFFLSFCAMRYLDKRVQTFRV